MKKLALLVAVFFVLFTFASISQAAEKTAAVPVPAGPKTILGVWTAIGGAKSPQKGKALVQLEIYQMGDTYEGRYVKLLPDGIAAFGTKCKTCTGERKDKPFEGMVVIWGLKKTGDNEYSGGKVYDTVKGDDFSCKLSLKDPDTLKLSGCLAFLCEHNYYPRVK
jgi:uncharacterized protein (DUF2147 family)